LELELFGCALERLAAVFRHGFFDGGDCLF